MKQILLTILITLFIGHLNAQSVVNYTTAEGLPSNVVNCIDIADDEVWLGTNAGVAHFDGTNWQNFSEANGLLDDFITAIHVTEEGTVWVGTDFGINRWDGTEWESFTEDDGISDNRIQDIDGQSEDVILFGTKSGLSAFIEDAWYELTDSLSLPFGGVGVVESFSDDVFAIGLGLDGILVFDYTDFSFVLPFTEDDGLLSNKVKGLALDNDEEFLWVATDKGLNSIWPNDVDGFDIVDYPSVFELPPPHEINQLTDVKIDSKGNIWSALFIEYLVNVGGISLYDGDTFTSIDMDEGLVGPVVNAIDIDSEDCVWVATSSGLSHYCLEGSSIEDLAPRQSFSIFPNPASTELNIHLFDSKSQGQLIEVYNNLGERLKVSQTRLGVSKVKISLEGFNSGAYYVRYAQQLQKFIVE